MNNLIATTNAVFSAVPTHEVIYTIKELGYDAIELWITHYENSKKKGETSLEQIKKALEETQLKIIIHAPAVIYENEQKVRLNMCSKNKEFKD